MVQMNRFLEQKLRQRSRERTYGHQVGKEAGGGGCGVMNWEIGIDIYTLLCIIGITNKNLLYKKINKIKFKNSNKKKKVAICAWVYLWAFYPVPLIYISVFVPVPNCLDYCSFVI